MADDVRITELARELGIGAAGIDGARRALEQFGNFSEPYPEVLRGANDLISVAKALLQARMELDVLMDTFPKKQRAIYDDSIEQSKKKRI